MRSAYMVVLIGFLAACGSDVTPNSKTTQTPISKQAAEQRSVPIVDVTPTAGMTAAPTFEQYQPYAQAGGVDCGRGVQCEEFDKCVSSGVCESGHANYQPFVQAVGVDCGRNSSGTTVRCAPQDDCFVARSATDRGECGAPEVGYQPFVRAGGVDCGRNDAGGKVQCLPLDNCIEARSATFRGRCDTPADGHEPYGEEGGDC